MKAIALIVILLTLSACGATGEDDTSVVTKIPRARGDVAVLYSRAPNKSCTGAIESARKIVVAKPGAKAFQEKYKMLEMDNDRVPYKVYFEDMQVIDEKNANFIVCIRESPFLGAGCTLAGVVDGVCFQTGAQTTSTMEDALALITQMQKAVPAKLKSRVIER